MLDLIPIFLLIVFTLALLILAWMFRAILREQDVRRKASPDVVSRQLLHELTRLVHDRQTAIRLLRATARKHRDRSPNWIAEKTIAQVLRDRRS